MQTLDIVAENPDKFKVVALAAGSNVTLLAEQVRLVFYSRSNTDARCCVMLGLDIWIFIVFAFQQVKTFKPQLVAVRNESLLKELKDALVDCDYKPEIIPGEQGVVEVSNVLDNLLCFFGLCGIFLNLI